KTENIHDLFFICLINCFTLIFLSLIYLFRKPNICFQAEKKSHDLLFAIHDLSFAIHDPIYN
ncbi:unnamed protein product, partial [Arabidopsis halleri]